jgi:hypothetical protein
MYTSLMAISFSMSVQLVYSTLLSCRDGSGADEVAREGE